MGRKATKPSAKKTPTKGSGSRSNEAKGTASRAHNRRQGSPATHGAAPRESGPSGMPSVAADAADLRFTDSHEWVRIKDRRTLVVGISEFAQTRLSDITSVELPEPEDHHYEAGEEVCVIEALNASATVHAPVAGTITSTNAELLSRPEIINHDPYGHGWIFELRPDNLADVFGLTDIDNYEESLPYAEEE